jgi:hypothetical protein
LVERRHIVGRVRAGTVMGGSGTPAENVQDDREPWHYGVRQPSFTAAGVDA